MKALGRILALAIALGGLVACGSVTSTPVFINIQAVSIRHLDRSGGLVEMTLSQDNVDALRNCLLSSREIAKEELETELLPSSYLVVVDDVAGRRSFELNSPRNFETKGHYFENQCLYQIISTL